MVCVPLKEAALLLRQLRRRYPYCPPICSTLVLAALQSAWAGDDFWTSVALAITSVVIHLLQIWVLPPWLLPLRILRYIASGVLALYIALCIAYSQTPHKYEVLSFIMVVGAAHIIYVEVFKLLQRLPRITKEAPRIPQPL
jgi:hypothetical protein